MAVITRNTKETQISLTLEILPSGTAGKFAGSCGVGFFDHMLNAMCMHGAMNIQLDMTGDLEVDCHHSIEDLGIVFGAAFRAEVEGKNLARFGTSYVPMDESLSRTVIDISGRPYLVFNAEFKDSRVGSFDTCMLREFFYAFSYSAAVTLHIENLYGENDHHKIESIVKAFARALSQAAQERKGEILSTKGTL